MSGTGDYSLFTSRVEVIYTDDDNKPSNTLDEINHSSADINKGFDGKFVWLRIHRALKPSMMANRFWTDIRDSAIDGRDDDLSKGAGGAFRYLQWSNDMGANHFVTDLAVWRSSNDEVGPPVGWDGKTDDINKGRGGDFLYLVWKVREYTGPKSP